MKISKVSSFKNQQFFKPKNINNDNKKSNENVSFVGNYYPNYFSYEPSYDLSIVDKDIEMNPKCRYIVDDDVTLFVGKDKKISLKDEEMASILNSAYPNVPLTFGKEGLLSHRFGEFVSRKHFQITKTTNGRFILKDLNSTNGTKILKNVVDFELLTPNQRLASGKKYEITPDSTLSLGRDINFYLGQYLNDLDMSNDESITIGRAKDCDIVFDDKHISRHHLKITKHDDKYYAQDLNSANGTYYLSENQLKNFNDFSKITDVALLQSNRPTIIPNDCQVILGGDFVFDTRNTNITSLLDYKDSITIGRSKNCDVVVEDFYGKTSNKHLKLSKVDGKLVACDLDSSNGTKIVPNDKIKPFYNGIENLELKQGNVGDCYLLASIYSLSKHPRGVKIIENMVKVDSFGNYIVTLPCFEPIIVRPDELDGQSRGDERKKSVTGELGIRAIERAYARSIKSDSSQTMFAKIDEGGFMHVALNNISGLFSNKITINETGDIDFLVNNFEDKGLHNFVFTCATKYSPNYYIDADKRFVSSHAYSIVDIDTNNRMFILANPHNTKEKITVSFDEFSMYFDNFSYADMRNSFFV